jgi:serine/threonine protein kinase
VSADVYSLSIILFELFSGVDPFPGKVGQIFRAKMFDTKPEIPADFPTYLKSLILHGWSKEPKERPPLQEFKSSLNKMLIGKEKQQDCGSPSERIRLTETKGNRQPISQKAREEISRVKVVSALNKRKALMSEDGEIVQINSILEKGQKINISIM